ncbi:hypothetical protein BJF93_04265 [Xaviernesmea oryzae]|uniref:Uncharacterized protein n=1 Tax=Xaviernesmea oryzae TaxID=464029 RepID=A0A1Q9AUK6_9HYPH|nr:DUF6665 family protein [Xaviernesmea oryzae]OLP59136.1 hypothetical protein BJF93_04265 [Xaviernesmea oryzae]SEK85048.1 hypothetical protein SAMN04487976_104189 [Xaviernesmea oryzae]
MAVRPPQSLAPQASRNAATNILDYEIMAERADALGRCGLKLEAALAALAAFDGANGQQEARQALIDQAADCAWSFFIQRELSGFRSNRDVIERYKIPGEVIARIGAVRKG